MPIAIQRSPLRTVRHNGPHPTEEGFVRTRVQKRRNKRCRLGRTRATGFACVVEPLQRRSGGGPTTLREGRRTSVVALRLAHMGPTEVSQCARKRTTSGTDGFRLFNGLCQRAGGVVLTLHRVGSRHAACRCQSNCLSVGKFSIKEIDEFGVASQTVRRSDEHTSQRGDGQPNRSLRHTRH